MATMSAAPTPTRVADDDSLEDVQASLRASAGITGVATNTAPTTSTVISTWPYYDYAVYTDSNGHSWTISDPNFASASYVNRTSDAFADACNAESWTATGLEQQVILVPAGTKAMVAVNSADNFRLFLAAPEGATFNISYIYLDNDQGPFMFEQFNATNTVADTASSSPLPCGFQLSRNDFTSNPNVNISFVTVAPIDTNDGLYVLNMTLATDPSVTNNSLFAGLTGSGNEAATGSGSVRSIAGESSSFPVSFVVIPLAVVSVILLAGLAWFLLRRRRRRRQAAGGISPQKQYTALGDLGNSSVARSRKAAAGSRRTSTTLGAAPPSLKARSVDPFEDGYQASEFIRSSSHEPSSPSHSYATLDPALGRRESLQSHANSYSTFSHPDMARRPGSDLSHGVGSYTMRDSLVSEDPFGDAGSDSGTAVSTKELVRDKG